LPSSVSQASPFWEEISHVHPFLGPLPSAATTKESYPMSPLDQDRLPPQPASDVRLCCQKPARQGVNRVAGSDGSPAVPAYPQPVTEVYFDTLLAWLMHRAADRPD
jgi:hypothetical protein